MDGNNLTLLNSLIAAKEENECLEFKAAKNHFDSDSLGKYVTALANEAADRGEPNAWLVFGVDDKTHRIVGSNAFDTVEKQNAAKLSLMQGASPAPHVDFLLADDGCGHRATIVKIERAPTAMSWKGHYYGRAGESLCALPLERINRLACGTDWSAQICWDAGMNDLSEEALYLARLRFCERHPELVDLVKPETNEQFLARLRLMIRGKLTNAAVLLFGKPYCEALLSPATSQITWTLQDSDGLVKAFDHFYCPVFLSAEAALQKIRNFPEQSLSAGTLFPAERTPFDIWTLREALVNAIAHQNFDRGDRVLITEYEGSEVVFSNAGSFLPETIENVLSGNGPQRHVRNRLLVQAMIDVKLMENVSSGIQKMFLRQKNRLSPLPKYDISPDGVRVHIFAGTVTEPYARVLSTDARLNLRDLFLLTNLLSGGGISREQAEYLKDKDLIVGRWPSYNYRPEHGSAGAVHPADGLSEKILDFVSGKPQGVKCAELRRALQESFPGSMTEEQQTNLIKNTLQKLRKEGRLQSRGRFWIPKED